MHFNYSAIRRKINFMSYGRIHNKSITLIQDSFSEGIKVPIGESDLYPTLFNVKELRTELVVVETRGSLSFRFVNTELNRETRFSDVIQITYDWLFGKEVHKFK